MQCFDYAISELLMRQTLDLLILVQLGPTTELCQESVMYNDYVFMIGLVILMLSTIICLS